MTGSVGLVAIDSGEGGGGEVYGGGGAVVGWGFDAAVAMFG